MEKAKYLLLAIVCLAFAGCMDGDWDEPSTTPSPWGNNSIEETNVITIAQLTDKYSSVFTRLCRWWPVGLTPKCMVVAWGQSAPASCAVAMQQAPFVGTYGCAHA